MQQQKRRRVFGAGLSVKDGELIYLCRAIKSRVFHGTFLSLGLGQHETDETAFCSSALTAPWPLASMSMPISLQLGDESRPPPGRGDRVNSLCRGSSECERKSLHARIEKLDLELSISNGLRLSDQLIQPLFGNRAVALIVNVTSVSLARRQSIDEHAKSYRSSSRRWSHDQMKIAGVKAVHDAPVGFVQHRGLSLHRPITGKGPMIEREACGGSIDARLVQDCTTGRRKVLGARVSDIVFRRPQVAPIGGSFSTLGIDRDQFMSEAADAGLGQQLLKNHFRLFVGALAELMIANTPLRIDEIEGRPIVVIESTPDRIVVIDCDRILDP